LSYYWRYVVFKNILAFSVLLGLVVTFGFTILGIGIWLSQILKPYIGMMASGLLCAGLTTFIGILSAAIFAVTIVNAAEKAGDRDEAGLAATAEVARLREEIAALRAQPDKDEGAGRG
jgi:biopolymer transport protein ExbB/TolQ